MNNWTIKNVPRPVGSWDIFGTLDSRNYFE
jgi:hypothetical protein